MVQAVSTLVASVASVVSASLIVSLGGRFLDVFLIDIFSALSLMLSIKFAPLESLGTRFFFFFWMSLAVEVVVVVSVAYTPMNYLFVSVLFLVGLIVYYSYSFFYFK